MPNHITNILRINGTPEQVRTVREALKGEEKPDGSNSPRLVDFERIVPMPNSLQIKSGIEAMVVSQEMKGITGTDTESRSVGFDQKVYEQCLENVRLHGHPTWHEWCRANWGTKWNAYQQEEIEPNILKFQTAWSMPYKFFQHLAARFPNVGFVIEFADEDIGHNCGTATYQGGVLVQLEDPDDPKQFAYRVKGYSDEDIAERERERE
jgi:hypothetical protein